MFKNVAAKFIVFAFNTTDNTAKTGDAANITAYVSKDYGAVTVLADTAATELDATNAKGYYVFDAAQGETNGDVLMVSAKSATANISVIGAPAIIFTRPTTGWLAPTTAGRTLDVSASGEAGIDWANIGSPTSAQNFTATQIQSVNNLAAGSDSINTTATSNSTLTTGSTVSGTYASTAPLDGTYWQISDTAGTLDMYFEFNVGATGVPTTAVWTGGLTTAVNSLKVYAYNWAGAVWDQVGALIGTTSLVVENAQYDFTTAHVGTGANLGLVRLRFQNTGLTAANFYTDQVLCGYTNVITAAQVATSVWQDATAGDFTAANSIGKALYIANIAPGAAGGHFISGANAGTTTVAALTITGAFSINGVSNVSQTGDTYAIANGANGFVNIKSDTAAVLVRIPAGLVGGRMDSHVGSAADGVFTFAKFSESFWQGLADRVWGASVGAYGSVSDAFGGAIAEIWSRLYAYLDVAVSTRASSAGSTPPTAAEVADAVWDEATSGHVAAGSFGLNLDTTVSSRATTAAVAAVNADTDDIQNRLPAGLIGGRMDSHMGSAADGVLTAQKFGQSYWDAITSYVWGASVGTFGTVSDAFGGAMAEMWMRLNAYLDVAVSTRASASALATVQTDADDIQTRLPAALVGGRMDSSVGAMAANTITASALASDAVAEIQTGLATAAALAVVNLDTDDIQSRLPAGLVGGRMDSHVGSAADGVMTFAKFSESFWQGVADRVWGASVGAYGTISDAFGGAIAEMWSRLFALLDVPVSSRAAPGDAMDLVTDAVDAASVAASGVAEIQTGLATGAALVIAQADLDDIQTRLPASLVGGRIDAHVGSVADGVITYGKFSQGYWDGVSAYVWNVSVGQFGSVSDAYGGAVAETWSRVMALLDVAVSTRASSSGSAPTAGEVADAVWDEVLAGHLTAGTTGFVLNAAGSAGDPWGTALPGAYGAGSAGFLIGTNINATISSRATAVAVAAAQADLDDIQSRLPAGLVGGRMDSHAGSIADGLLTYAKFAQGYWDAVTGYVWGASVGSFGTVSDAFGGALAEVWSRVMALLDASVSSRAVPGDPMDLIPDAVDAAALASSAVAEMQSGLASSLAIAAVQSDVDDIQARLPPALVGGRMDSHVGSVADGLLSPAKFSGSFFDGITDRVWGASLGAFTPVSDSFAEALTEIRNRVALNLDVAVSSRAAPGDIPAVPTAVQNADALLVRNLAGGSNGGRTVQDALRILRNRMLISGTTLTVFAEDDTTPAWTSTLATSSSAEPIVGSDPA